MSLSKFGAEMRDAQPRGERMMHVGFGRIDKFKREVKKAHVILSVVGLVPRKIDAAVAREIIDDIDPAVGFVRTIHAVRIVKVGYMLVERGSLVPVDPVRERSYRKIDLANTRHHACLVGGIELSVEVHDDVVMA